MAEKKESLGAKIVRGAKSVTDKVAETTAKTMKSVKTAVTPKPKKEKSLKTVKVTRPAPKPARAPRAKVLVSIVNYEDDVKLKEILDDRSISLGFSFAGTGTAKSAVLDYLGIGAAEKSIVISLIPESDEDIILREIRQKMSLYLVGRGISFTIPLSGASEIVASRLTGAATVKTVDGRKVMKDKDRKFDLIIAAVAAGRVDEAMDAARAAGAAGGTVIRARSLANAKAEQFIGITLTQEQELLLILTKREGTHPIMQALSEKVGLKTEAGGVIFALPVDRTAGISAADEQAAEERAAREPAPEEKES